MIKRFILLLSITGICSVFQSCEKETDGLPDVNVFIEQLKHGDYPDNRLPRFGLSQIPELLQYRNEKMLIESFPVNPVSSYYLPECRLGVYILWTIEYIRKRETGEADALLPWPSLSPVLTSKNPIDVAGPDFFDPDFLHEKAATAYYTWWENKRNVSAEAFVSTNPLQNTGIRWW